MRTEDAWTKNRRVEFQIKQRAPGLACDNSGACAALTLILALLAPRAREWGSAEAKLRRAGTRARCVSRRARHATRGQSTASAAHLVLRRLADRRRSPDRCIITQAHASARRRRWPGLRVCRAATSRFCQLARRAHFPPSGAGSRTACRTSSARSFARPGRQRPGSTKAGPVAVAPLGTVRAIDVHLPRAASRRRAELAFDGKGVATMLHRHADHRRACRAPMRWRETLGAPRGHRALFGAVMEARPARSSTTSASSTRPRRRCVRTISNREEPALRIAPDLVVVVWHERSGVARTARRGHSGARKVVQRAAR